MGDRDLQLLENLVFSLVCVLGVIIAGAAAILFAAAFLRFMG